MLESEEIPLPFAGLEPFHANHWHTLTQSLKGLGAEEIALRKATARRVLREQGVSCPRPEMPGQPPSEQPWEMDLLPVVLSASEWEGIEVGLSQRARLLNRLLRDLYGAQQSLRNGWLPAAMVYSNPNYLRPCHAVRVPADNYLPFYAADLARSQDGQWWVVADRTQNPAGLGFALENRALMGRVMPEALQRLQPRSLEGVLPEIRETIASLTQGKPASVVVLSPGLRNESYFDHSYLARKLCCPLAEGADLTVRGRRVFLKTVEGLSPVDVILRRVNDAFCDPLELRADSFLGVPGLLEAVRAGNVALANPLGGGWAESPALLAFLPGLCRKLLGQELALPSLATWWCGGAEELKSVRAQLGKLALHSAWSLAGKPEARGDALADLQARLLAAPQQFIGQEEVHLCHAPMFDRNWIDRMEPYYLRVFLVGDGDSYRVLPAALARLPGRAKLSTQLLPLAQPSKDTWVLGRKGNESAKSAPVIIGQAAGSLPSRAAENLFWLSRYAERFENLVRIARCVLAHGMESGESPSILALGAILPSLGVHLETGNLSQKIVQFVFNNSNAGSMRDLAKRMHLAGFAVRERLSADTWRLLNQLQTFAADARRGQMDALALLDRLVLDLAALSGLGQENMTRGHGWLFLDLGRRLERTLNLLVLLRAVIREPQESLLEPMLEISDSMMTFRRRYFSAIRQREALELLLLDYENPRSLAFQIRTMERTTTGLPMDYEGGAQIRREIAALATKVRLMKLDDTGEWLDRKPVEEELGHLAQRVGGVSEGLTQIYFSHSQFLVS